MRLEQIPAPRQNDLQAVLIELQAKNMKPERRTELTNRAYEALSEHIEERGGVAMEDMNALLNAIGEDTFIVRREDPIRITSVLEGLEDIRIQRDTDLAELYANAVQWRASDGPRGLQTAFLEGHGGPGGIVTVFGALPGHDLNIYETAPESGIVRKDRGTLRSIEGAIHPDDIRFILMRIPAKFMNEDALRDTELEQLEEDDRTQIFRAFTFPEGIRILKQKAA